MTTDIPEFDTAVERFRLFLEGQNVRGDLVWVRSGDLVVWRTRHYLRARVAGENDARAAYARGRAGGIGVCLQVVCLCGSRVCCGVWFVESRAEAEYRMCAGLKLMCPVRIREARLIRNRLVWAVLKRVGRGVDLDSRGWRILRSGS